MTAVRRVRGLPAVLATIAAATLATTAQGDAHAATGSAATGASGPRHTTLRVHVAGCDRCTVQLQHAISGKPGVWTSRARTIGPEHRDEVRRLSFRVARVRARTLDGHRTRIPLTYASHSMSSWKPVVKTYKGTIGNQDAFYCTKP